MSQRSHIVVCWFTDKSNSWIPEQDFGASFDEVARLIWSGEYEPVRSVIEMTTLTDVTREVAQALYMQSFTRGETPHPCVRQFLMEQGFCWYVGEAA